MKRKYWPGLAQIKGIGPIKMSKLLDYFGDAASIWEASKNELAAVGGIGKLAEKIVRQREKIDLDSLLENLARKKIKYMILEDKNYPSLLKNIYDPPPVLFYKGTVLPGDPAVAIVGSRKATSYGRRVARELGSELSRRGIQVISGMARGIDSAGHRGALMADGRTIAVMGSGLDYIYPPENRDLFTEIVAGGLAVSEFPPGAEPLPGNFPRRNRIISGLSRGVVVVEAAARSGSLITARLALEQGREVFAVPGNIDRLKSRGTNDLIKQGARPVTGPEDIFEELFIYNELNDNRQPGVNRTQYPELTGEEEAIIKILQQGGRLHINQIIEVSDFKSAKIRTILLKLELKGLIAREEGKKYEFKGLQNLLKPI